MCVSYVKVFRRRKPLCLRGSWGTVELSSVVGGDVGVSLMWRLPLWHLLLHAGPCCVVVALVLCHQTAAARSDGSDPTGFDNTQL